MKKLFTKFHSTNYLLPLFSFLIILLPSVLTAQVQGKVFRDFNSNGVFDSTATFVEVGLSAVTVTAYNAAGTSVGTTTTNATGNFTIPSVSGALRIEFTNFPAGYYSGMKGTGIGTSVQFVTAPTASVSFALNYTGDYCQTNAPLVTPCYIAGDATVSGSIYAAEAAVVKVPYNHTSKTAIATLGSVGSTWGMAYNPKSDNLYMASMIRRHTGLGLVA